MSGVFWEAEKQPNLCEAASGFTLSTLNLMVAVPMAVVDLLVSLTLSLASLAMVLLSPLLELVTAGFTMILAALGLEDWTRDQTLVTMAVITILAGIWHQHRGHLDRLTGQLVTQARFWLWLLGFLAVTPDSAIYPRLVSVALAFQMGSFCIEILFKEFNSYSANTRANALNGIAGGLGKILDLESMALMILAMFGYPTFSATDAVTQYYCLVPLVAVQLLYFTEVKPEVAVDDVDAPHANGDAVPVKEVTEVAAPVAKETALEDGGAEAPSDAPEVAAEDKAADGSAVENISEAEQTEALIKRLQGCVTGLCAKLTGLLSPITGLVTKVLSSILSLPWTSITLLVTSNLSHVLAMMAWLALTSNPLAYGLPVLSLGLPKLLASRLGDKIPASLGPSLRSVTSLASAGLQYSLLTGVTLGLGADEE